MQTNCRPFKFELLFKKFINRNVKIKISTQFKSQVKTRSNLSNSVLITVDVLRDTLDGQSLEIPGTSVVLPKIKILLDFYRKNNKPIVHIVRIYKADGSNVDLCRKESIQSGEKIFIENSLGSELAKELFDDDTVRNDSDLLLKGGVQEITKNEVIIYKPRWGAFYKTPLENHLKNSYPEGRTNQGQMKK